MLVFSCSGTRTLAVTETDPSGSVKGSVRCNGTYATTWAFPAGWTDTTGKDVPPGPGPYRIVSDTSGTVTAANVFVVTVLR